MLSEWYVLELIEKHGVNGAIQIICTSFGYNRQDARSIVLRVDAKRILKPF